MREQPLTNNQIIQTKKVAFSVYLSFHHIRNMMISPPITYTSYRTNRYHYCHRKKYYQY